MMQPSDVNAREIVATTMMIRAHKAVYLPGALDRIVEDVARQQGLLDRRMTRDEWIDAIEIAIVAEEKHPERDAALFDAMALPGWREWAAHAGEMR